MSKCTNNSKLKSQPQNKASGVSQRKTPLIFSTFYQIFIQQENLLNYPLELMKQKIPSKMLLILQHLPLNYQQG